MAFPNTPIQAQYNRYQERGRLGQIAKLDNNTWYFDVATSGVELRPGQGVYINPAAGPTLGQWILPVAAPDNALVTHIVSFEQTNINTSLSVASGNALSEVVFPAETPGVKAVANGTVFVTAGDTILRGASLQFDFATNTYINALPTNALLIIAQEAGVLNDVIPVRITRRA